MVATNATKAIKIIKIMKAIESMKSTGNIKAIKSSNNIIFTKDIENMAAIIIQKFYNKYIKCATVEYKYFEDKSKNTIYSDTDSDDYHSQYVKDDYGDRYDDEFDYNRYDDRYDYDQFSDDEYNGHGLYYLNNERSTNDWEDVFDDFYG